MSLPKDHLSPSSVNMYLRCPKQFEIHYVDGRSSPPGFAMLAGDALDKAVQAEMSAKLEHGRGLPKEVLYEEVSRVMEEGVKALDRQDEAVIASGGPEKTVSTFLEGSGPLMDSVKSWADSYEPAEVQQELGAEVGGYPMKGYADLVSQKEVTTDTKLWTRRKDQDAGEKSNQLRLYQIMRKKTGRKSAGAEYQGWYPLKHGYSSQTLAQSDSPEADARMEEVVFWAGRAIEAGFFPPVNLDSQNAWVCTKKFCGFWESICLFGARSRKQV